MIKRLTVVSLAAVGLAFLVVSIVLPRRDRAPGSGVEGAWQETTAAAPTSVQVSPPEQKISPDSLSPEDRGKLTTLSEIMTSKNDNDPRLDSDFRDLSVALKQAMRAKYYEIAPENRASRGTIVFLLGREIKSPEDIEFLTSVLGEKPCLSFENCSRESPDSAGDSHDHHAGMNALSLSYPELTGLNAFRNWLADDRKGSDALSQNADLRAAAERAIRAARASENPLVASRARDMADGVAR